MNAQSPARPEVLITADFDAEIQRALDDRYTLAVLPAASGPAPLTDRLEAAELERFEAIVCETDLVTAEVVAACPRLRLVVSCRANPVNVDTDACRAAGVDVVTTPARNADATADLAFTLLLMTIRQASAAERWLRAGEWNPEHPYDAYETFRGMALNGRTLGLVGAGAVGRRVAQRALGFGMRVIAHDPFADPAELAGLMTLVSLDEVMSTSDVVSIHAPLNESTSGLIGAAELALMKPSAFLVNAGRAAIVSEEALLEVLGSRAIAGAGLDVYWTEPLAPDHPLLGLANVVLTPHIGGASDDAIRNHSRQAAAALAAWVAGDEPPNLWRH
ncbi:MAG: NAD(P)-dependent oxidoreductase [Propionicimonas sp.]